MARAENTAEYWARMARDHAREFDSGVHPGYAAKVSAERNRAEQMKNHPAGKRR